MALSIASSTRSSLGLRFESTCVDAMVAELRFLMLNASTNSAASPKESLKRFMIKSLGNSIHTHSRTILYGNTDDASGEAEVVAWSTFGVGRALKESFAAKTHSPGNTLAEFDALLHASRQVMSDVCTALATEANQPAAAVSPTSSSNSCNAGRFVLTASSTSTSPVKTGGGHGAATSHKAAAGSGGSTQDVSPPNSPHRGETGDSYVVFEVTHCSRRDTRRVTKKLHQLENACGLLRARYAATKALRSSVCPYTRGNQSPGWLDRRTNKPVPMSEVQSWVVANAPLHADSIDRVISFVAIGVPDEASGNALQHVQGQLSGPEAANFPYLCTLHQAGRLAMYGLTSVDWVRSESDAEASANEILRSGLAVCRAQLHAAKQQLNEAKQQLQEKDVELREAREQRRIADINATQLSEAKQQLNEAKQQLNEAKQQLREKDVELREARELAAQLQERTTQLETRLHEAQQLNAERRSDSVVTQRELLATLRLLLPQAAGSEGGDGSS